jgi:tetraacyldisaccharide 4'-kinase
VELLARALTQGGRRVVILSRGHGRCDTRAIVEVSDGQRLLATPQEAGDEPFLLARRLQGSSRGVPVVVGPDRFRTGRWAFARFQPDVLLLDDGFQQLQLRKDADIVCLDARAPWGPGGLFPRGSLREPPTALLRAHLLVLAHGETCTDPLAVREEIQRYAGNLPLATVTYEADGLEDTASGRQLPLELLGQVPTLAFAGIAVPDRFRATLAGVGGQPRAFVAFPDHYPYRPRDLAALEARARAVGAEALVTTEKDAVRWPGLGRLPLWVLHIRPRLDDPSGAWWTTLESRLVKDARR